MKQMLDFRRRVIIMGKDVGFYMVIINQVTFRV